MSALAGATALLALLAAPAISCAQESLVPVVAGEAVEAPAAWVAPEGDSDGSDDLEATFHVLMRASSRPDDWIAVGTAPFEPAELGLKLRFDACGTTGAWWIFDYGDGTWNADASRCWDDKRYTYAGSYNVTLTIFDEPGNVLSVMTKTVTMGSGMQHMDATDRPGVDFSPYRATVVGTHAWSLSTSQLFSVCDIATPGNLGAIRLQNLSGTTNPYDIASAGSMLYIADGTAGVLVYTAVPDGAQLVGQIPRSALQDCQPTQLLITAGRLFVGCLPAGRVFVFDLDNPQSPAPRGTISFTAGLSALAAAGDAWLFARRTDGPLSVFDMRGPGIPVVIRDAIPAAFAPFAVGCSANAAAAADVQATRIFDVVNDGLSPVIVESGQVPRSAEHYVMTDTRLYLVEQSMGTIYKYDISQRQNPYLMETRVAAASGLRVPMLVDPDGAGPQGPVLLVGCARTGFLTLAP